MRRLRWAVVGGIVLGWLIMLWRTFVAFTTVPPPEVLEDQRMTPPPALGGLAWDLGESVLQMALLVLLLWPGRARAWRLRLALAGLGMLGWFLLTVPLGLTTVEQVHRQWELLVAAGLLATLLGVLMTDAARRLRAGPRRAGPGDPP